MDTQNAYSGATCMNDIIPELIDLFDERLRREPDPIPDPPEGYHWSCHAQGDKTIFIATHKDEPPLILNADDTWREIYGVFTPDVLYFEGGFAV